ncbi:hypothetical protein ACTXK0_10340 [Corynebacterium variabile]|uniref:Cupin n=1 Tax=Corynebacterium variabile TaxID=1727 RepID=A0A4Y4C1X1_9CORY|nr:hypothetical protein [Corynebacterium variabile]GEC85073.1 hypothetical protein CVA01_03870 [Corynebacterium variabile]
MSSDNGTRPSIPHQPAPTDALRRTSSGDGWMLVDGLQDAYPGTVPLAGDAPHHRTERAIPSAKRLARLDGATVVRLSFRAGDVMADHSAAAPILIMGQVGEVEVTVADGGNTASDGDSATTVRLSPGQALSIAADRVHSLSASGPATVTLLVLNGKD